MRVVDEALQQGGVALTANRQTCANICEMEFNLLIDHAALEREKRKQTAILNIREQYGKNAILTGTNFMEGATTRQRNEQIGGHRAG